MIDVNGQGDLAVYGRGRLKKIIDKSHLPKGEHRKAEELPEGLVQLFLFVFHGLLNYDKVRGRIIGGAC